MIHQNNYGIKLPYIFATAVNGTVSCLFSTKA